MGLELRKEPSLPVVSLGGVPDGKYYFVLSVAAEKDCDDLIAALEEHGELVRVEASPKTIKKIATMPDEDEVVGEEPDIAAVPVPLPLPVEVVEKEETEEEAEGD